MNLQPQQKLFVSWLIALAALLFSLYFSELRGWTPCFLCWYQRICLWPLVPILAVTVVKGSSRVVPYILPQLALGFLLAAYQVLIQDLIGRDLLGICRAGPDCAEKVDLGLGPVSIPMMSMAAFILLLWLLLSAYHQSSR